MQIIEDRITGDRIERVLDVHPLGRHADHGGQLALVVELDDAFGTHDDCSRTDDRGRKLGDDPRRLERLHAGLGGVIRVVATDRDDLGRTQGCDQLDFLEERVGPRFLVAARTLST